jgi:hypothetical protein
MSSLTHFPDDSLHYGPKLYSQEIFGKLFPTFDVDQRRSADLIWTRILSKCGTDPDLPQITHAVDFGCGEGTFLKHLIKISDTQGTPDINFQGIDCCPNAISIAKEKHKAVIQLPVKECSSCPKEALGSLDVPWQSTVLMVMGHSWFHIDQESLLDAIRKHRPAIVLVDIYSSWDDVIISLRKKQEASMESAYELEHGRIVTDENDNTKCYWLRTEIAENSGKINRGIWCGDKEPGWHFKTSQFPVTSEELFGGLTSVSDETPPEQVLLRARSNGHFVDSVNEDSTEPAYVHDRQYSHNTGWGPMRCHVLISLDPVARILNRSWFKTIRSLIQQTIINKTSPHSIAIHKMLNLFDETFTNKQEHAISTEMTGSREGLVILPFDQNAIFARIVSLFDPNSKISDHPLLVEHPTRWQTQFPSANGLFQTCIGKSSSPQAFATDWAHDYELTPVDKAIIQLEIRNLGLQEDGKWPGDQEAASYFMVPFYKGSLPLFCLALKFPRHFSPVATQFDVYLSTIESFHAAIQTMLTDDVVRQAIIRPWIEDCLNSDWPNDAKEESLEEKLLALELRLFGGKCSKDSENSYDIANNHRKGGVLSKEWKSWILGLPSFPINKMAKVIEENRRLWQIWENEKEIALLDPALRISLWFQHGKFFEEKAHEHFDCSVHLPRLREMFANLDVTQLEGQAWSFSNAINSLRKNYKVESSNIARYFGKENTQHFLFRWLLKQLTTLAKAEMSCDCQTACSAAGSPSPCSCAAQGAFDALKAVFCKTNANTGRGVRFDLIRLWHLLDAARSKDDLSGKGALEPSDPRDLNETGRQLPSKFWSEDDPSIHIAEFVQCLARMECLSNPSCSILAKIQISIQTEVTVALSINNELKDNVGGKDKHKLDQCAKQIRKHCTLGDIHWTQEIKIQFSLTPEGEFKPASKEAS